MPRRSARKLTKRYIDSLEPVTGNDYTVWDSELTGFGLRVKPSGLKSFQIKYYTPTQKQRKATLGKFGSITVEQARKLAQRELGKVAAGRDPILETRQQKGVLTVAELCDEYYEKAVAGKILYRNRPKKPTTLATDKGRITRHIKPLIGDRQINALTRREIEKFMHDVRDGKTAVDVKTGHRGRAIVTGGQQVASKSVFLLSAMYRYALKNDLVEFNPCLGIEKPAEGRRDRYLREHEYQALGNGLKNTLNANISPIICKALIALLLTGCRRGEILNLQWQEVDVEDRCLRLKDTKTGPQMRPCGKIALDFFTSMGPGRKGEWVFPSNHTNGPITEVRNQLNNICEATKLSGVSPHIFRHSYATVAFELGYSELIIAGLLGHHLSSVTSRYAHKVDHVLSDAADQVSETIWHRLFGSKNKLQILAA